MLKPPYSVRTCCKLHGPAEGELRRGEGESRIDFLSKVRNKALEPLWTPSNSINQTSTAPTAAFPADRILYMNDVFVCAKDFIRLMLHDADMVCALDYWQRNPVSPLCCAVICGTAVLQEA